MGLPLIILASCLPLKSSAEPCGPTVSRAEVLAAANRYISHYSIPVPDGSHPNIYEVGCNYVVIYPNGTDEAREDLTITVDRRGRIKNIPECCELRECPEFC